MTGVLLRSNQVGQSVTVSLMCESLRTFPDLRGPWSESSAHAMLNRRFESQGRAVIQFLRWI